METLVLEWANLIQQIEQAYARKDKETEADADEDLKCDSEKVSKFEVSTCTHTNTNIQGLFSILLKVMCF